MNNKSIWHIQNKSGLLVPEQLNPQPRDELSEDVGQSLEHAPDNARTQDRKPEVTQDGKSPLVK